MKQSHIVASVMNLPNFMSMVTILPRIPMMVTTPVINLSESSLASVTIHKHYSVNSTRTQQIPDILLVIPQYQSLCNEQFSRKAGGQITIHEQ